MITRFQNNLFLSLWNTATLSEDPEYHLIFLFKILKKNYFFPQHRHFFLLVMTHSKKYLYFHTYCFVFFSYILRFCSFFYSLSGKDEPAILGCLQQFFIMFYCTNFSISFMVYAMCDLKFRLYMKQLFGIVPMNPTQK